MFLCKREPNNAVILKCLIIMQCFGHQPEHWAQSMFVVSHHCLTTKHDRTHWSSTRKISTIAVCDITALFDIDLVTNRHGNLKILRHPIWHKSALRGHMCETEQDSKRKPPSRASLKPSKRLPDLFISFKKAECL